MSHPAGFHKSDDARLRCWGCSAPERLEFDRADAAEAERLRSLGFAQVSAKYRLVARPTTPRARDALAFTSGVPHWLKEAVVNAYDRAALAGARYHGEVVELTPGVFRAFKAAEREPT